jgi:hypothetical protein
MRHNYGPMLNLVRDSKANVPPFVEEQPLDKISTDLEAVQHRRMAGRVILVRGASSLIRGGIFDS